MDHGEAWRKFGLRPRKLEIISGVIAGYTIKEIADHCEVVILRILGQKSIKSKLA